MNIGTGAHNEGRRVKECSHISLGLFLGHGIPQAVTILMVPRLTREAMLSLPPLALDKSQVHLGRTGFTAVLVVVV